MTFGCEFWLELGFGIGDWDGGLELGIGIGDWDGIGDWGLELGIGCDFGCDFWF